MDGRFRNRVKELREVRAGDLMDHEGNWHVHPAFQTDATEGSLEEHGIVDVLIAYESKRHGGLKLVDGHDRKGIEPDQVWPVIILDIDDDEAETILGTHDIIGKMGQVDALKLEALLSKAKPSSKKMQDAIERMRNQIAGQIDIAKRMAGDETARQPKRLVDDYEGSMQRSVKAVIPIEDGLDVMERALKATGIRHRGNAFLEVCTFYLNHHEGKGKNESAGS